MSFLAELKRRKVFQAAAVYAVVAWLLIQVADVLMPTFGAPEWVMPVFSAVVILGFPLAIILAWAYDLTPRGMKAAAAVEAEQTRPGPTSKLNQALLAMVTLAVVILAADRFWLSDGQPLRVSSTVTTKPAHLTVLLPEGTYLALDTEHPAIALSPDGSRLVFVAYREGVRHLYMRELAGSEAQLINGTAGAAAPFFSPDSEWLAYVANQVVRKIPVSGGASIKVTGSTGINVFRGIAWSPNGQFIRAGSRNSGLSYVSAEPSQNGTNPLSVSITPLDAAHSWPEALPDGDHVLFTDNSAGDGENAAIGIVSAESGEIETLVAGGVHPRYSPTGHLLYARSGALYTVPFDVQAFAVSGTEALLAPNIVTSQSQSAEYSVSNDSTLAYVAGEHRTNESQLVWVDRGGDTELLLDDGRQYFNPRLSPDGSMLALSSQTGSNLDVWVLNLSRGNLTRWTTHPGEDFQAVWGPDNRIVYASEIAHDEGEIGPGLAWQTGSGGDPEYLSRSPGPGNFDTPSSWSTDGRYILYRMQSLNPAAYDIYIFDVQTRETKPYLETPFREFSVRQSPDDRWVAYVSNETGIDEVYIRSFPVPGDATQISVGGGDEPVWSSDGGELYYRQGSQMLSVALGEDPTVNPGDPSVLFEGEFETIDIGGGNANYDVSPVDGRFLMIKPTNVEKIREIQVVLNWPEALGVADD
jgi:serine/threonine-protein kinase